MQFSQSEGFAFLVCRQPDVRHAAAIDEFLKVKAAESARAGRWSRDEIVIFNRGHKMVLEPPHYRLNPR